MSAPAGERIEISAPGGGRFEAFTAAPDGGSATAVLVLPEVFGANEDFRATVLADLVRDGFPALAPDIYWRLEPHAYFAYGPEGQAAARALRDRLDVDTLVADLGASVAWLRAHPRGNGKVAVMGFCLGGRLAFLAGTRLGVDGVVSYYGVGIEERLDEVDRLGCPALLHFAETDEHVPEAAIEAIAAAVRERRDVTIERYPGTGHAFNRRGHPPFVRDAATLAWGRSLAFLEGL